MICTFPTSNSAALAIAQQASTTPATALRKLKYLDMCGMLGEPLGAVHAALRALRVGTGNARKQTFGSSLSLEPVCEPGDIKARAADEL
jgi:hypothetical protein